MRSMGTTARFMISGDSSTRVGDFEGTLAISRVFALHIRGIAAIAIFVRNEWKRLCGASSEAN